MSRSRYPGDALFHGEKTERCPEGEYRTLLTRELALSGSVFMFVGLNPSTADATNDDATIRRVIGFALREGARRLLMCNLFALRSTDPDELYRHKSPSGDPQNMTTIIRAMAEADIVVAGWGVHGAWLDRGHRMVEAMRVRRGGRPPFCLGRTRAGHPSHPLYLRADAPLEAL